MKPGNTKIIYLSVVLVFMAGLCCCSGKGYKQVRLPEKNSERVIEITDTALQPDFNDEEQARIQELRDSGGLKAAVLVSRDNYYREDDGTISGMDYHLAAYFTDLLDMPLVIDAQESFSQFFADNGEFDNKVVSNENIVYIPDLLKTNDLYILPLTINPWRERLTLMIPMKPSGVGIYGLNADEIISWDQLDGLTVALLQDSYTEQLLESLEETYNIQCRRLYHPGDREAVDYLLDGTADFSLQSIIKISQSVGSNEELSVSPLLVTRVTTGWAVKKDDDELFSIITKLYSYALEKGIVQKYFKDTFDADMEKFLSLLGN